MKEYQEFKDQSKQSQKKVGKILNKVFKYTDDTFFNKKKDNELSEVNRENTPDIAKELFKEINPMGLFIGDVKKNLENEIMDLEILIKELETIHPELNKELVEKSKKEIVGKKWWVMKINDFLMDKNIGNLQKINPNLN